jgi:squalene-associated FAD-dependent desaturase
MSLNSVIVIGGGLAGLSSAVVLAESGYRVRLLEKRPHLGGRAASYVLPGGEHVDNCQHVTLGCCTNLEDFYRRINVADKIKFFDELRFAIPDGERGLMKSSWLPPPLHMATSFLRFPLLDWADKVAIARALLLIARSGGRPKDLWPRDDSRDGSSDDWGDSSPPTMLDWLTRHGQTQRAIRRFWEVILVSALDEDLDRTDARHGVTVFWKGFLATRRGYRVGIPCVPLGDLYDGCRQAITQRGGEVVLRAGVSGLRMTDGSVEGINFADGSLETADAYVAAVPQDCLPELLPDGIAEGNEVIANLARLRTSPITGVHLWFDTMVMREPFLTLLDSTVQWVFNKTKLYGGSAESGGQYLQLVISASYSLLPRSRQDIIALCLEELREVLPAIREAKLIKGTVVKETSATFSPSPGSDRWRPAQKSPFANLYLAGDWTATGWPSTMEGAVRSGYLAAEAILRDAGTPRKFLQPDLHPEGLSRLWSRTSDNRA